MISVHPKNGEAKVSLFPYKISLYRRKSKVLASVFSFFIEVLRLYTFKIGFYTSLFVP